MTSVQEVLTGEESRKFQIVLDLARRYRTLVGLELPDEEAALNFSDCRKFGNISDTLCEFFQLRRERWPHLPLLTPPTAVSASPRPPENRKFRLDLAEQRMSWETESRLWSGSTGRVSQTAAVSKRHELQRLIVKMIGNSADFVEGATPLTASVLLQALATWREEYPTLLEKDVLEFMNENPKKQLQSAFGKHFGYSSTEPVLLFNFFCDHKPHFLRGFSNDQILASVMQEEISDHVRPRTPTIAPKQPSLATVARLAKPKEPISEGIAGFGKEITDALTKDKTKPVVQVYTEVVASLTDGNVKRAFLNFFAPKTFRSRKVSFPIRKFPCVVRAVEVEAGDEAVGGAVELHAGEEVLWRSEISQAGMFRIEQLVYISRGPVRVIGNFCTPVSAEVVQSEIYTKSFEILVEDERRRLTMTASACLRLSRVSDDSRFQAKLAKLRTLVKTNKFSEAQIFLAEFGDDRKLDSEISDLTQQIEHHFFLLRKVARPSTPSAIRPPSRPISQQRAQVVFGRTLREDSPPVREFKTRAKQTRKSPEILPATEPSEITEKKSEISDSMSRSTRQRLCLAWLRTGECPMRTLCRFSHGDEDTVGWARQVVNNIFAKVLNSNSIDS